MGHPWHTMPVGPKPRSPAPPGAPRHAEPGSVELSSDDRRPVTAETKFRDYILTRYEPRCDPAGTLEGSSLLRHLLRSHGMLEAAWPILERLRDHLGPDETVWGFKLGPAGASLELYLYNFDATGEHPRSTVALAEALEEHLRFAATIDEAQPYFMCSFELTPAGLASGDGGAFRIYVASGDEAREACGFSFRVEGDGTHLENHYWFYRCDQPAALEDVVRRVVASPRAGGRAAWGGLLPRWLRDDCFTVCYAVKPRADGLYYARIGTEALARFLGRHGHPDLAGLLSHHRADFAALRWDLGFDFAAASPSATSLSIDKIAIHGVV